MLAAAPRSPRRSSRVSHILLLSGTRHLPSALRRCPLRQTQANLLPLRAPADAAKLSSNVKSHLPGSEKSVKKDGEVLVADAGKRIDQGIADAKSGVSNMDAKLESYRKDAEKSIDSHTQEARKEASAAIDKFDKSVTEVSLSLPWMANAGWVGDGVLTVCDRARARQRAPFRAGSSKVMRRVGEDLRPEVEALRDLTGKHRRLS